jgi:photosystem II stability/assembly factor-like uncharacterized protein
MTRAHRFPRIALLATLLAILASAEQLRWRLIGPFRGGRVTSVAGVQGEPNTYYFGTPGGGIWKTTSGGQVWKQVFDSTGVYSIGSIAVAPSNSKIVYAGTGERQPGRGVYRSSDGGMTWSAAGLDNARYIQALIVDPRNPDHVVAGVNSLGYSIIWRPLPNTAFTNDRGIYQTTDGGRHWNKVLTGDDTIGVVDLCADPNNPRTLYAVLYHPASGKGKTAIAGTSDLYRSLDGGSSWRPLASEGLPEKGRGRIGISVAKGSKGKRLYAVLETGFFRSDDGGAHWSQSSKDPRVVSSNYFSRVFADPTNADVVYVAQTSFYRSTDGGHTFEPYVGAPSGDDFHVLWIDPMDGNRMLLGVDQGAIVTVDGGMTWSSWYNQPTGEFYHVTTDQSFPYRVYAAQQDSGTAGVVSRSDYGEITAQDWSPVGGFEYTFIAPDPANANLVYSQGWYGSLIRYDRTTGMVSTVFEKGDDYRTANMAPLVFSPQDPKTLYLGTQYLLRTTDAGLHWARLGPDLTAYVEPAADAEPDPDAQPAPAISALGVSAVSGGVIWAGTTNHILQLTRDAGTTWHDVSPPGLTGRARIQTVEAGRHDASTAYVTGGAHRDRPPPYIARTHDSGLSWQMITKGIPADDTVEVVREDPARKGLLYAGTSSGVFVSYDDGDHWQSLQLNLPHTTVSDLDVHGEDLVASTFGRGLWILDGLAPVREHPTETQLLPPATAIRARWDNNQDTPNPRETPVGENPPDGAIVDFFLKTASTGEATLTVSDSSGAVVRRFSTNDKESELPLPNVPGYWFAPPTRLPASAGMNRIVWDLRTGPPKTLPYSYGGDLLEYTEYTLADHAIPGNTPRQQPVGPLVPPGQYTIELAVGGQTYRQILTVRQDPRIPVSDSDLAEQWQWEQKIMQGMEASYKIYFEMAALKKTSQDEARKKELDTLIKGTRKAPGVGPINRDLSRLCTGLQNGDVRPSDTIRLAIDGKLKMLTERLAAASTMKRQ